MMTPALPVPNRLLLLLADHPWPSCHPVPKARRKTSTFLPKIPLSSSLPFLPSVFVQLTRLSSTSQVLLPLLLVANELETTYRRRLSSTLPQTLWYVGSFFI